MKLNIFLFIFLFSFLSCTEKKVVKDTIKTETKIENKQIASGWNDQNTYTVNVTSENLNKATEKAKHQILLDIVKVRMLNESRFTDITKINAEFETPLKNGKVISEKKVGNGVEIYYQITDEGLKQKFEKK